MLTIRRNGKLFDLYTDRTLVDTYVSWDKAVEAGEAYENDSFESIKRKSHAKNHGTTYYYSAMAEKYNIDMTVLSEAYEYRFKPYSPKRRY